MDIQQIEQNISKVLKGLHIEKPLLLGKGGEGWIYEYGNDVLKIYTGRTEKLYLTNIQKFQATLSSYHFSFDTPQIYEIGEIDGIYYTFEKRLCGIQMDKKINDMSTFNRKQLYRNYYNAIQQVNSINFSNLPYGQIIQTSESVTASSWTDFLVRILENKVIKIRGSMQHKVVNFDDKVKLFKTLITQHLVSARKNLVHCDYFLNNVLVEDDLSISAVLDFSAHAAVGDPLLDIAGVLTWNEIDPNVKKEDYLFLYDVAKTDYGDNIQIYADLYLLFSSFYFSDMEDPSFSIRNLNNDELWIKYK